MIGRIGVGLDALALIAYGVGLGKESDAVVTACLALYGVGPIQHLLRRRWLFAGLSALLRIGAPWLGGYVGYLGDRGIVKWGMVIGAGIGAVLAMAVDWLVLHPRRKPG